MKKLLFLLLVIPVICFAQIRQGQYKLSLAANNLRLTVSPDNYFVLTDDCKAGTPNCGLQVWQISNVTGKPNVFKIYSVVARKYLTWEEGSAGASALRLTLKEVFRPNGNVKYEQFKFVSNNNGSYQILPNMYDGNLPVDYFLSGKTSSAAQNMLAGVYRQGNAVVGNTWLLEPPVTPLPVQQSATVVVRPPGESGTVSLMPIITVETVTGGDDLRGGGDNVNLIIRLKPRQTGGSVVNVNDLNNRSSWGNFSTHIVKRTIRGVPFKFEDILDITLKHTGGSYGAGLDNWYLDKLKVTLTIAGETKVLVDLVDTPIHYFKGDSRSKTFQIIR